MRFTDDNVNIDEKLISALNSGELVIFLGAGVSSRAYPRQNKNTYYPLFNELVNAIGFKLGRKISDEEKKYLESGFPDRILGEWERDGDNVHVIASEILQENEKGQRINLHRGILRLFSEGSEPRIVTTNFDNLLIRTLEEEGLVNQGKWKIHEAPSLPPANNRFKGICFLHGRVGNPEEMILTDKDIGRAYMEEGWALRFAYELFHNFSVLFIGYGLQDPPLRYLSLALEGKKKNKEHWALIASSADPKEREALERDWRRRGVTPIWFPAPQKDYRALERNINTWAEDVRRLYLDKKNYLASWALVEPNQLPQFQLDRARYFLQDPELLREFLESVPAENWFYKLLEWGHFDLILKNSGTLKNVDISLARKLISWLLESTDRWIANLLPYRKSLNLLFFEEFCRQIENKPKKEIEIDNLRKILEFLRPLLEKEPTHNWPFAIEKIFEILIENSFVFDATWLFMLFLHAQTSITAFPGLELNLPTGSKDEKNERAKTRLLFNIEGEYQKLYTFTQCIEKIFLPNIEKVGYSLIMAMSHRLFELRQALRRGGGGNYTYIGRKAIEKHEQDKHEHGIINFLLDSLRDIWEALLAKLPDQAMSIFIFWRSFEDILFRRLSLHAARKLLETNNVK